jgi:hypothetical protein
LEEALASPQAEEWEKAIASETTSLFEKGTFSIVDTPRGVKPIATKWVFKTKYDAFGFLEKFKVRLVAKGFLQRLGIDYDEVFSPVSKLATLRVLLAHVAALDLELKQVDVSTAFLNGELYETIHVAIPPGLSDSYPNQCFLLRKAIYGLKQAPRVWYLKLTKTLTDNGFTPTFSDPCLLTRPGRHGPVLMLVYVDDILVAGHPSDVDDALHVITSNYECSPTTDARSFLGMAITRDRRAGTLTLAQPAYVEEVAKRFHFDTNQSYSRKTTPLPDLKTYTKPSPELPPDNRFASLVGALLYLANCTRPDISFAVNTLAKHLKSPCEKHMGLAKHLLRYVLCTKDLCLTFHRSTSSTSPLTLTGFSDSDFANATLPTSAESITRRSVSGVLFLANGSPILWLSKKQVTVARSSDEAELQAMATAASQGLWLRKLYAEIAPPALKMIIYCDNQTALTHVDNPGSLNKTKHVDLQHQFVLDRQTRGDLTFTYIPSNENLADMLTKGLTRDRFQYLRNKIL